MLQINDVKNLIYELFAPQISTHGLKICVLPWQKLDLD